MKSLYIKNRFFYACIGVVVLFVCSFVFPSLFWISKAVLITLLSFFFIDVLMLFGTKKGVEAKRFLPEKFSNGDQNEVEVRVQNNYNFPIAIEIIDELPVQFQKRDFIIKKQLLVQEKWNVLYKIRPTERGEYHFGNLHVYIASSLGLAQKRLSFNQGEMVRTYPSFLQIKKFDLLAFNNHLFQYGIKKVRRLGHTLEFEQIKEYVMGDDIRTLNWKATAKKGHLMVNQYQDEKSQPVYAVIDKGRGMQMPFNKLTLLDYAINAVLMLGNVVLKKQDKFGMFTFSKKLENRVVAEKRTGQMHLLLEALYNIQTNYFESDFSRLYTEIKINITHRSLIILYTNFETMDALNRQLPYLRGIAKMHLLLVVFFKNTELHEFIEQKAVSTAQIYNKVIAEKFEFEKKLIVNELRKYGIFTLLTEPENLTINNINKYLEIKARGMI